MKEELRRDITENNISHAYLFYGEAEEIFAEALNFAMILNCQSPRGIEPCGTCRHCLLGKEESFSDLRIVRPEKTNYTVKQIRGLIREVQFTAQEGQYRIFLLENIDKLNEVSANTLLKTLEEPALNTVFLLLSSNPDKTLATIESRCRILRWHRGEEQKEDKWLDKAYALLTTLPRAKFAYIFQQSQEYSSKDKTKGREDLRNLIEAIAEIISRNYGYRHSQEGGAMYILSAEEFGDDTLMYLWAETDKALEYLEYQVTTPLIAETLFLAMKNPLNRGNQERRG